MQSLVEYDEWIRSPEPKWVSDLESDLVKAGEAAKVIFDHLYGDAAIGIEALDEACYKLSIATQTGRYLPDTQPQILRK